MGTFRLTRGAGVVENARVAEDAQLLELLAMLTVESSVLHACSDCVGNLGGIVNVKKGVCNAKTDVKSMWERSNKRGWPKELEVEKDEVERRPTIELENFAARGLAGVLVSPYSVAGSIPARRVGCSHSASRG